ncbi:MAG: aminotransferase class I/II-fold pyridoxal phosphate-dependent enzyme [Lachnospiraceae bacterium]|nr:aminotransferase class I/II-fold pyridoxal phosphate-dependent enzyme [Lachnospiraceae bacterium]
MEELEFNGLRELAENGSDITNTDMKRLESYKVDNAIIMAAGYSARCMPLSNVMPKGLFRVKGEILIEREIEQLLEAGINEIIVVTGFMNEKFEYLKDKYGVTLVYNGDYDKYNNMASLYVARQYIKNSYILCSDNYYEENVFHKYIFDSYYSCVYSQEYCDEFCVTDVDGQGYITGIHRGGSKAWYTVGDAFFNANFSRKFCQFMEDEWDNLQTRNMLMDDFHIKHIQDLKMKKVERPGQSILEFDTLEEIKGYDTDFIEFINENLDSSNMLIRTFSKYADVKSYHSVPTEQMNGRLHLNENLFKPSSECFRVLKDITMEDLYLYDLSNEDYLLNALSVYTGISTNNIFMHNGSSEVIKSIFSILLNENDVVLVSSPGWSYYKSVADSKFAKCITYEVNEGVDSYEYNLVDLIQKAEEYHPKIIVLTSPHMPTGCVIGHKDIEKVIETNKDSVIMVDQAYWGYGDDTNEFEKMIITKYSNVVITRTFSKFYGLANIRIGYGLCSYPLRRTIGLDLPLFRVCGISRKIALAAITDKKYYAQMKKETIIVRDWFVNELNRLEKVKAFQSDANFVFIRLEDANADKVRAFMEENNILIRLFIDKDALRLRITIAPKDIMERVLFQLKRAIVYEIQTNG